MKQIIFIATMFTGFLSNAQKIEVKRDLVLVDKEPVCKFINIGTITNQAYTIKNMIDEELILIDQSQLRDVEGNALLRFMFADMPNAEAFMPVSLNFRKQMSRLIVTYNLIEKGKLVPKNVQRFCNNYNGYFKSNRLALNKAEKKDVNNTSETANERSNLTLSNNVLISEASDVNLENGYEKAQIAKSEVSDSRDSEYTFPLLERDIEQEVYLSGNTIRQDFKDIGNYSATATTIQGKDGYIISFTDMNSVKVAEAKIVNDESQCELLTLKDNKLRQVTVPRSDLYTIVKDLVSKLSFLMYL